MAAELSIVSPPSESGRSVTIAGVLLAAGTSSRFGESNKLLAEIDGVPIVRIAAKSLLKADLVTVTVVVGFEEASVRAALEGLSISVIANPEYVQGQASSVATGVEAIHDADIDAAVFALGDMPYVKPSSVNALIRAYSAGMGDALAAAYEGNRGNPVLFDTRYFDRLVTLSGDRGGRELLLDSEAGALVETGDPGVLRDIDTRGDLP